MNARNIYAEMIDFCKTYNDIYIYGAGVYAKSVYEFITGERERFRGFITSSGDGECQGYRAICVDDVHQDKNIGIILGLNEQHQEEVLNNIDFTCGVFRFTDYEFAVCEVCAVINQLGVFEGIAYADTRRRIDTRMENILVVQCEVTFGDMIWSTAFLRELRNNLPNANIDILINYKLRSLYENCPYINNIYGVDCGTLTESLSADIIKKVKMQYRENVAKQYDSVFLPRLLPMNMADVWENIIYAMESGASARYGHAYYITNDQKARVDAISSYFTNISKHLVGQHEVTSDLDLIKDNGGRVTDEHMELWPDVNDYAYAKEVLEISEYQKSSRDIFDYMS